ncbi:Ferrochelatase [Planctomycetales bacterium 10988]|nr:Ferrochelatase [Planctomycetales bacterium 10988]
MPRVPNYDALLVVSFGGPEGQEDVLPFLENVLRGKNVPRERMLEVAEHYKHFGGVSPLNGQIRELIAALEAEFDRYGIDLPIYWGNRNWHPMLADTFRQMKEDGIQHVAAFVVSGYSSYSGCRQYRENLDQARAEVGEGAPTYDKLRVFYNHPDFIRPMAGFVEETLGEIPEERREATQLIFTAHSVPMSMARTSRYQEQLTEASRLVAERVGHSRWKLVYQSRSGPPSQPWLEPDICDYLEAIHEEGVQDAVICPIGFLSDHMEVLYDLDTEAKELCEKLGINMLRTPTIGTHPQFVSMIRDLVLERAEHWNQRPALGKWSSSHDVCPLHCCPRPVRPQMTSRSTSKPEPS